MSSRTTSLAAVFITSAASLIPLVVLAAPTAMAAPNACQLSVIKTVSAGVKGLADVVTNDQVNGEIYITGTGGVQAINARTYKQVAVITTGKNPYGTVVNPGTDTVYVANLGSSTLSVINGKTNKVTATVPVAQFPFSVAVDRRTGKIYVTSDSGAITIVSARTNRVTGTIHLGDNLLDAALDQVTGLLYVTNDSFPGNPGTIFVVNVNTRKVVARIHPGGSSRPSSLAVNPRTNTIYVTDNPNPGPDGVLVISGASNKIISKIPTELYPGDLSLNPSNNLVYVVTATEEDNAVMEIDGSDNQLIATQEIKTSDASFIGVNIPASYIYVTAQAGQLVVLNGCRP
jgi:YVTN family beta-propeller protein